MIYLGTISGRVPIVPPFAPDHHIREQSLFYARLLYLTLAM